MGRCEECYRFNMGRVEGRAGWKGKEDLSGSSVLQLTMENQLDHREELSSKHWKCGSAAQEEECSRIQRSGCHLPGDDDCGCRDG